MGLDSIIGVEWLEGINKRYGTTLSATKIYEYPSIVQFAEFIRGEVSKNNVKFSTPVYSVPEESQVVIEKPLVKIEKLSDVKAQYNEKPLSPVVNLKGLEEELVESLAECLAIKAEDINIEENFIDMGLDSIIGVEWLEGINKKHGTTVSATKIYEYPSISKFSEFFEQEIVKCGGGISNVTSTQSDALSLKELIQQVSQGALDVEKADYLLQQLDF